MNKTGNNNDRFSIINVVSGRNSWMNFTVRKIIYWKINIHFPKKNIHLLCLMHRFKHTKICKWKRFIWRKKFVMDNPVYVVYKQVSAAFYFDFDFATNFGLGDSGIFD